ncbi:hypothetical protein QF042_003849 [Pedobacter sp. W3I1]|uniref:hypothetical protein n=1 Tax=Pedobacter sp. W3I1 TaxID=3042291 RepID=UPI00277D5D71|nr:hypothetical protein [Pedobacter sp. W3I1]MDQ0640284.1 hypothetical protein [Pedobacter sp. W3I1]
MEYKIITKFTIGSEEGTNDLAFIAEALAREKFSGKIVDEQLEEYIQANFNKETLRAELNSMSNQYLIVYVDNEPAGYSKITSKGLRPEIFEHRTMAKITDFGVLKRYADPMIRKSLFDKSLMITTMQQVIWISDHENENIVFFETFGFKKDTRINITGELALQTVNLVKENSK